MIRVSNLIFIHKYFFYFRSSNNANFQVRWSGEHVPGSPFIVMIFDTEEELNRFLQVKTFELNPFNHSADYNIFSQGFFLKDFFYYSLEQMRLNFFL